MRHRIEGLETNRIAKIGLRVIVTQDAISNYYIGRIGTITSINQNPALPIGVTLDGQNHETDFKPTELKPYLGDEK